MKEKLLDFHGEPSFHIHSGNVEFCVTPRGGHMAPVTFNLGRRKVAPYALAPWQPRELPAGTLPLLSVLRGDFFCLPFGESKGIAQVHGETANGVWQLAEQNKTGISLEMKVKKPACLVRKSILLKGNHRCIYQQHLVSGLKGRYNFGHHAIIQFPEKGGPFHVNTSPFSFGSVKPEMFSNPQNGEYGALKTGAQFRTLSKVPLANGGSTSLNQYPARRGFEDLIMVTSRKPDFAWTAVTLDGYIWFSLKNPEILPSTLFWISNGGRHGAPWSGRHTGRLGLEEVNSHFCDGLEISRKDRLKKQNIPTTRLFSGKTPTAIKVIQGVHPVPSNFGMVSKIVRDRRGQSIIISNKRGQKVDVPVDWKFLF